jgi:hypothetical protein
LAGQPNICLVNGKGYYFEAYDWRWTKTDIPNGTNLSAGGENFEGNLQEVGIT